MGSSSHEGIVGSPGEAGSTAGHHSSVFGRRGVSAVQVAIGPPGGTAGLSDTLEVGGGDLRLGPGQESRRARVENRHGMAAGCESDDERREMGPGDEGCWTSAEFSIVAVSGILNRREVWRGVLANVKVLGRRGSR